MTRCRTGCDAEINYKRVFFSNPLDWYDIPMEGDVIHDCSKVKPFTNDPDFDVLKELEGMHKELVDQLLFDLANDYGTNISDFINLPQELEMHSKEWLAEGNGSNPSWLTPGEGDIMVPENYDKLSESRKKELKETYGFELPNQTPEERQAEFRSYIDLVMGFLQRCADRFPAPFYTYGGYSQLELFRIFLESRKNYNDALICHIIQGAIDTEKSVAIHGRGDDPNDTKWLAAKVPIDMWTAFTKVAGRLQKKRDEVREAEIEAQAEYLLEEQKRFIRQGMNEKEASEKLANEITENRMEESMQDEYPALTMQWAMDLFKTVAANKTTEETEEDDGLEHRGEQIEVGDTVNKEQSVEELLKPHSQEVFGRIHSYIRKYILYLYDDDEKDLWDDFPGILSQIKDNRNRQKSSTYPMVDESDLGFANIGQLDHILSNLQIRKGRIYSPTKNRAKKKAVIEHDEYALLLKVVKFARNALDHENTRKELPLVRKMMLVGAASILMTMMDDMKYR